MHESRNDCSEGCPEFLYRFRSICNLLGRNELENQEIYFAHPSTLNDPIEGYLDIFWQGDRIVWVNLFKHYLLCLQRAHLISLLNGPSVAMEDENIQVFLSEAALPTDKALEQFKNISTEFFANPNIHRLIDALGMGGREIRRDELFHYLQAIHGYALAVIRANENPSRTTADEETLSKFDGMLGKLTNDRVLKLTTTPKEDSRIPDALFTIGKRINEQYQLLAMYRTPSFLAEPGKRFVVVDFPLRYINQLERLLYPPWYTACFMNEVSNASMWGHYGNAHQGVCLKFKTTKSSLDRVGITLNCITGYSSVKGQAIKKIWGNRFFTFEKIAYDSKCPRIDFFRSIGRLPFPQLMSEWYSDGVGNTSKCAGDILGNENQWRTQLWANLTKSSTVKLEEWQHEKEYRILLMSMLSDLAENEDRLLKYHFSDLAGIVFGIKTPIEHKVRIFDIIEKKCIANKRDDFKFYQATYSHTSGKIEIVEMNALKPEVKV